MIQEAIFDRLANWASLQPLVGAPPNARIFLRENIQRSLPAYPFITYEKVSETRLTAMQVNPGLVHGLFQVEAIAKDPTTARNITEQLRKAIERWRYTVVAFGTTVQDSFVENVQDPKPELVADEFVFRTISDVMIHYTE
jgi:hypothetical protein